MRFLDFETMFRHLMSTLLYRYDYDCAPRGERVLEIIAPTVTLVNPRERRLSSPARAANYRFAAGEFLWYARAARDVDSIAYYNPRMRQWSDDGATLNSAYGAIVEDQLAAVAAVLAADPDSRRAVATIYSPDYLRRVTKDVPCTLALQFLVRDGALHLHVTMRSNDVVWGLTNDLFSFTLLQELMQLRLRETYPRQFGDLRLGQYHHTAGSLHLYERHFAMAHAVVEETHYGPPAMPPLTSLADVDRLLRVEQRLRATPMSQAPASQFVGGERWLCERLNERRAELDAPAGLPPAVLHQILEA